MTQMVSRTLEIHTVAQEAHLGVDHRKGLVQGTSVFRTWISLWMMAIKSFEVSRWTSCVGKCTASLVRVGVGNRRS